MIAEQRGRLFGELRPQRDPLLGQPPHQFGVHHLGRLDRLAALEHLLDQPRLGFRIGPHRARVVELGIDLAHLLVRQRRVVGPDEQRRLGAEVLDLGFGVGNLLAQILDLAREPLAGIARLVLARILLEHEIAVGDRIGDAHGEIRVSRLEFDHDHARLVDGIGLEAIVIGVEHPLFRRHRERIAADADQRRKRLQR
ncbi:hypothetical protein ACVJGC_007957 [Bradyrhizobium diazoefficiens]